jgi:DNA-binding NtrC family response regulator
MRRAVALAGGPEIPVQELGILPSCLSDDRLRAGLSLNAMEKRLFELTLNATSGNRSRAAELLGVSLRTVRNKIRDYGLPPRRSYVHD